jgi:Ca2+-binding RTX toxin-like protein
VLNGGKGADRMDGGRGRDRIEARDGVRDIVIGRGGTDRARVDWALDRWSSIELSL